jgi:hypothetical protein
MYVLIKTISVHDWSIRNFSFFSQFHVDARKPLKWTTYTSKARGTIGWFVPVGRRIPVEDALTWTDKKYIVLSDKIIRSVDTFWETTDWYVCGGLGY